MRHRPRLPSPKINKQSPRPADLSRDAWLPLSPPLSTLCPHASPRPSGWVGFAAPRRRRRQRRLVGPSGDSGAGLRGVCPPTGGLLRNGGCGWSSSIFRVGERVRCYWRHNLQGLLLEMLFLSVSCFAVFVGWHVVLVTPLGGRNQATLVGVALIGQGKGDLTSSVPRPLHFGLS